ncbi:MAG: DUF3472 domain-containing protein [Bacteroidaceae bacterium]|nr:DUF3472 domain-containing protein [Bacteroidaceae bacterium]
MKKLLLTLLALAALLPAQAFDWQAKVDTIWPARHYREFNGDWSGDQMTRAWIDWRHPEGTILVYGIHFPTGYVRADALFQCQAGKYVTFGVRIVHPATGTVVLEHSATSTKNTTAEQRMEIMPPTDMPYDGWYRFELTCPDGMNTLSRLNIMEFQRESKLTITDSEIFMAPSVHLWWSSTVPGAPTGQAYDWTYLEVMYPQEYRHVATYQMAIGTDVGYSGIQMPTRSDGSYGNSVLFSVWDNGDVEKDRNLPEHMRSAAVDVGEGAYATRFGGEGTGSSIRFYADTLWQFDHWVQFLLNERPDHTQIHTTTAKGNPKVIDYQSTLQSMWFKMSDEPDWHYIGTLRVAGADRLTSGIYSFLENFGNGGGEFLHRCYFRNGAMRSAASGQWFPLNKAGYGNTQNNGSRESRYDFGHGVTALYDNTFYLETGGYMGTRDSADSYRAPALGEMPWVDSIDIDRLNRRIDLAVTRNHGKTVQSAIEATRTVSDPATWKLTSYSDEETVGEGDNGRAAFILDGDATTYYHNKWKNGSIGYPHTFTFDAGEPVTVSSIELYQNRDQGYRAKQLQLYTSDDGSHFSPVSSRLDVEDTDYPTVALDSAVTSRYFRLRFLSGYGSNLVINELYFKHEYRLPDLLALAESIFVQEDQFGGYAPADLLDLHAVYNALSDSATSTSSSTSALLAALQRLGETALPLTYGVVGTAEHLSSFCAYQLHNLDDRGDLIATSDGTLSIAGAPSPSSPSITSPSSSPTTSPSQNLVAGGPSASFPSPSSSPQHPCSVTSPLSNWLILYSAAYKEYYLYNLGARKFLSISATSDPALSDAPCPLNVTRSGNGFLIGVSKGYVGIDPSKDDPVGRYTSASKTTLFELRNNYALTPATTDVLALIEGSQQQAHIEAAYNDLCQQAIATYSKAFVTTIDRSTKLIRNSSALSSNVNSTQQDAHNLAKLVDGKTGTYWESWYSGITWPSEPGYVQAKLTTPVPAFYLTFTPSQHAQYGRPDIPQDLRIYTGVSRSAFDFICELTDDFPTEVSETYTSPAIFSGQDIGFIRMECLATLENRDGGRVFAMSELQLHPALVDSTASLYCQRPWVRDAVDALSQEIATMRDHIHAKSATPDDAARLQAAIDRAEASYLDPTGISAPWQAFDAGDTAHRNSPYSGFTDLSGRRLTTVPTRKGIYLHNGRKYFHINP